MLKKNWIIAGLFCTALAACGQTLGEQAVVGGAAGAGVGAITGGNPVTGAIVGGAANVAYCQTNPRAC